MSVRPTNLRSNLSKLGVASFLSIVSVLTLSVVDIGVHAQSKTAAPTSAAPREFADQDPFILGPLTPLRQYNSSEAVQWGVDFIISPSGAKDRVVLYAYDLGNVDSEFFRKFETLMIERKAKIAVVSNSFSQKFVFLANEGGFFGVPIIADGRNKSIVRDFVAAIAQPKTASRFLAAVVAVALLKSGGLGVEAIRQGNQIAFERPWQGVIASSLPIAPYKATKYIASSAAWDLTRSPPEAIATLSELQSRLKNQQ